MGVCSVGGVFESVFDIDPGASEAQLRDQIAHWERLKATAAAAQARATALWAQKRRAREQAAGMPAAKQGRGLASEVALARHDSPVRGNQHLGFAKALVHEMPHTLAALESGVLSEWRASLIVKHSACLTVEDRALLDAQMCADQTALASMGNARVEGAAAAIAARLDAAAVVHRKERAAASAGVWTRPAANGMVYLTALLPLARGIGIYAALKREADLCGDGRARGRVMTDTLYQRVTGQPATAPVPVAVNLVMADTTLIGDDQSPGWVTGYGPVPATIARALVQDAALDETTKPRCAGSTATPTAVSWSRWNRGPGSSRKGWRRSSTCATRPAAPPTATPRSATTTTPPPTAPADPPTPTTGSVTAKPATTPKKPPDGPSPPPPPTASTTPNTPPRPGPPTTPPHHRYRAPESATPAGSPRPWQ